MWLYVFGSLVRGEFDTDSDVDLLCISEPDDNQSPPASAQRYSTPELEEIFSRGDLFAHHLHQESRLIHSTNTTDIIKDMEAPAPYTKWEAELRKFLAVLSYAAGHLAEAPESIFHKGLAYMALRDIGMIYSYTQNGLADFSKHSPYNVSPKLQLAAGTYNQLRACRLHSTRNAMRESSLAPVTRSEIDAMLEWAQRIDSWRSANAPQD